jgi:ketosteroid isomerase-like protein
VGANVEVIRRIFTAFARRDFASLSELTDPELEFWAPTARAAGRDGVYRGRDGLREYLTDVGRVWEELRVEPRDFRELGDVVVVTGRVYAWGQGRVVDTPAGWLWRLRDGRIVEGRVFDNEQDALAAGGLA